MTSNLQQLYFLVNDEVSRNCDYRDKLAALATAKIALLEKMRENENFETEALVDVYTLLDGEIHELHQRALFEATLSMGLEMGRLRET